MSDWARISFSLECEGEVEGALVLVLWRFVVDGGCVDGGGYGWRMDGGGRGVCGFLGLLL